MQTVTPVLFVDRIEPSVRFWVDLLGFQVAHEVMEGEEAGFVILVRDELQLMYQSYTSVSHDIPELSVPFSGCSGITYIKVPDLRDVEWALRDVELLVPRRTTAYGAVELFVREPGGHVVGFAEFRAG